MTTVVDEHKELRTDLFINVLRSAGEARLAVTGASMLPAIWPGDVLQIHRVEAADLSVGDIVVLRRDNRLTVHRLVELRRQGDEVVLITRGDRSATDDPPFSAKHLLGNVQVIRRGHRSVLPAKTSWRKMASFVLRHSELLTTLVLYFYINNFHPNSLAPERVWAS